MKRSCAAGFVLLVVTACLAPSARAQWPAFGSSLSPLPSVTATSSGVQPASYYSGPVALSNTPPASQLPAGNWCGCYDDASQSPGVGSCDSCCDDCASCWFAVGTGLIMTRNRAPAFWTTTTMNDPFNLLLNTQNAAANWVGGGQATFGYACGGASGPALVFTYWGLAPMEGSATVSDQTGNPATALSSTLNWGTTTINGNPATLYFENAQIQGVWREDRTDNVEVNIQTGTHAFGGVHVAALCGFRYFRFSDELTYGSASFGNSFTSNGGADAAYVNFRCNNNLYGGQVGGIASLVMTRRISLFAIPKVGVYGNQMNNLTLVYAGDAQNNPDTDFTTHKSDVSVLSELDLGLSWAFHSRWRLSGGYRIVSVTNLALADNQFAAYGMIEQSGSLILHGAFIGLGAGF